MKTYQGEPVHEEGALLELFNAMIYVLVRHDIKPFNEPAVVRALEMVSVVWDDTTDTWVDEYKRTYDAVQEAAQ
jgi:hypothetical protein